MPEVASKLMGRDLCPCLYLIIPRLSSESVISQCPRLLSPALPSPPRLAQGGVNAGGRWLGYLLSQRDALPVAPPPPFPLARRSERWAEE